MPLDSGAEFEVESRRWLSLFEVRLEAVDSVGFSPEVSMLLAFGCCSRSSGNR
jgi:hypothetical protein